ncbi:MAG: thiamine-binding protein [Micrococcus sp.]|nr:thiamine-binding protein [Micrococcus sp.]
MIVAFSVAPSGTPADPNHTGDRPQDASVHDAVAAAVQVVRDSGLPHRTSSMFTEIEGERDEVMAVVKRACDAVAAYGSRVSLVLKADIRPGYTDELHGKLQRLEKALDAGAQRAALSE